MRSFTAVRCAFLMVVLSAISFGQPQQVLIPQIADGNGWQTTLVLTNTTTNAASATLNFFQETQAGATQAWTLPFSEGSAQTVQIPGGSTMFLHTLGTAASTSVGWAQFIVSPGVVAYAIFTQRIAGHSDQDGTAPGGASSERFLVPFDKTSGFITGLAMMNPSGASETVSVNIQIETGAVSQSSITLPPQGHMSFAVSDQFPATAGHRGLVEFYFPGTGRLATGALSAIALRFNPTGGFTSAPAYGQTGSPVVGVKPPPSAK
jgi:hypothetical protein